MTPSLRMGYCRAGRWRNGDGMSAKNRPIVIAMSYTNILIIKAALRPSKHSQETAGRECKHWTVGLCHQQYQQLWLADITRYAQNKQFYLNVLIPGAYLIKSVKNVQSLTYRNDIFKLNLNINNTFPRGYDINKPIADYILRSVVIARLRKEDPIFFEAPEYALSDVRKFLNNINTRKKITY